VQYGLKFVAIGAALSASVAAVAISGCRPGHHPTTQSALSASTSQALIQPVMAATGQPSIAAPRTFTSKRLAIRVDYPAEWTPQENKDFELLLRPAQLTGVEPERQITLDVPDLPFHVPGMIPLRLVKNGYLDDLKKQAGPLLRTREESCPLAGSETRLLKSTWQKDGRSFFDTALVIVHADHVYILRAAGLAAAEPTTQPIFDAMVKSLRWNPS
jgi:hypothetical protein